MIGIGTDLVELDRFRSALARTPTLAERLFTPAERAYAQRRADPTERLAVRFAAKEATLKAMGLGLGTVGFREIEVVRDDDGRPALVLHGRAADAAAARGVGHWLLTMTHTECCAQAIAVALAGPPPDGGGSPAPGGSSPGPAGVAMTAEGEAG